jgi:hypothetical protein
MKKRQTKKTPDGFFGGEAEEYLEKAMFGGVFKHYSHSEYPWEIDLVLLDEHG